MDENSQPLDLSVKSALTSKKFIKSSHLEGSSRLLDKLKVFLKYPQAIQHLTDDKWQKIKNCRNILICSTCFKFFDRPSLLQRHVRSHTGEKPNICDDCGKAFSTSSSLNTHRRIHSGEKPFSCTICSKTFTASSNLYYHKMIHFQDKPHKCQLCPRSFPTPGDLRNHSYTHSGLYPFKCPCGRGFAKRTALQNHLKSQQHTRRLEWATYEAFKGMQLWNFK